MTYKVIDDFLATHEFQRIQSTLMGANFPWYLNMNITRPDESFHVNDYQLVHSLFEQWANTSPYFPILEPLIEKLNVKALLRAKVNLGPATAEPYETGYHSDYPFECKTACFYVNTNNGYTKFESGEIVESVANRVMIFDSLMKHTGVTQTDQKVRAVLNLNYFD